MYDLILAIVKRIETNVILRYTRTQVIITIIIIVVMMVMMIIICQRCHPRIVDIFRLLDTFIKSADFPNFPCMYVHA